MTHPKRLPSTKQVPDYVKADFSKLKESMSIDWSSEFADLGAQVGWTMFKTKLHKSMDDCIPNKTRWSDDKTLWMNNNIMRLITKKRRLWNWYKTTRDYAKYQAYFEVQKWLQGSSELLRRNSSGNWLRTLRRDCVSSTTT